MLFFFTVSHFACGTGAKNTKQMIIIWQMTILIYCCLYKLKNAVIFSNIISIIVECVFFKTIFLVDRPPNHVS
jgi:hypothetical protein